MTRREFMNAVIAFANTDVDKYADLMAYAEADLEKLDETNKKRAEKANSKKEQTAKEAAEMAAVLTEEPMTASDLGEQFEVSTQKASALMRKAVEMGLAIKQDVKIKGKGTVKGYTKA